VTLTPADATDPNSYPIIKMEFSEGTLSGTVSCNYSIMTNADGITIKCDGEEKSFSYNTETGEFTASLDPAAKKITVCATNIFGYTTIKTMEIESDTVLTNPFSDTEDNWAKDILSFMYSKGIVNGESADGILKFNPQKQMTRSEFAVMMVNYLGVDTMDYQNVNLPYTDLDTIPFWALDSFKVLYELGIVKGRYISDTESCADPLTSISRAEAATIVSRILPSGIFKSDIDFADKADIPYWAEEGIATLINVGAMKGYEDGTLKPMQALTKAESAKILYSVM